MIENSKILFLLIFIFLISLGIGRENFENYNSCKNQGYPLEFCMNAPNENYCICPAGQKIYKRYGRCYCQTYN